MKPTLLPTPGADAQADIVRILEDALVRAKAGEFLDVALFARKVGNEIFVARAEPCDRMMLVACLERAKWELCQEMQTAE